MSDAAQLSESLGDYLETIYRLARERKAARVKDIADAMGVHMSSVTGALKALVARGMVYHDRYSFVTLTERGEQAANELARSHEALSRFFHRVLGLDAATADHNACHVEHAIEPDAMARLVQFIEYLDASPLVAGDWRRASDGAGPSPALTPPPCAPEARHGA